MISWESLAEEAKNEGLPLNKKRAILRKYIQAKILNIVYKSKIGDSLFFMGGTALMFIYKLPRFSEDLDFNTRGLKPKTFEELLGMIKKTWKAKVITLK